VDKIVIMPTMLWSSREISAFPALRIFEQGAVATMITKECFGCEKVTSHEHLHDCAPGIPETHMVGSERFVCVLCKHVTFAGSDGGLGFVQLACLYCPVQAILR
jgi:hypothetical protein